MTNGQERLVRLQQDIANRLRPVCQDISESSFEELVREIAAVKLKYGEESEASESIRVSVHAQVSEVVTLTR